MARSRRSRTVGSDGTAAMVVKDVHGAAVDSFTFAAPPPACATGGTDGGTAADAVADGGGCSSAGGALAEAGFLIGAFWRSRRHRARPEV